ncbi:MAG: hypothetical protein E6593_16470 [Clostridium sp.]|nr:hypothetical protein [Clostridium sp.]
MEQTQHYNLAKPGYEDGADIVEINSNMDAIDTAIFNTGTHTATHTRTGTVNNLAAPDGAKNLTFLATAANADGDSWTINGQPVTAVLQNGEPVPGELFKAGCWVTGVRLSDDGGQLTFTGIDVVKTATANKILRLDASGRLPATATGTTSVAGAMTVSTSAPSSYIGAGKLWGVY